MKKSSVLGGLAFAAILGSVFTFPVYAKEKTFPEGIYAGGFALGGLTKEQAETQFAAYISGLEERSGSTWSARIWKRSRCIFRWMQV